MLCKNQNPKTPKRKCSSHDFLGKISCDHFWGKMGEIQQQMVVSCEHIVESTGEGGRSRNSYMVLENKIDAVILFE